MATTKEILKFAVEMGDLMLRNGAEIYRVEDTVLYILKSQGIDKCDVYVLSNGIFASANEDMEDACSVIRHVPLGAVHLGRLSALNQLTRDVCAQRISIEEGWGKLEQCKCIPEFPLWVLIPMCGMGAAGFAYMFGGSVLDALVALGIGCVEEILLYLFAKKKASKFIKVLLVSGYVSFACALLLKLGVPMKQQFVIIGSIMPVVPGIAFTTGIRDFYNGDYLSGTIHVFDALLTAACVAVGSCLPLAVEVLKAFL